MTTQEKKNKIKSLAEDIVKDNDGVKSILERYIEPDDINLCVSEIYENQSKRHHS